MFFLNNKLQLQKLMGKYLWSDCSLFFLPAWSPGVSLFLQAFLRGHRIGIQQIRHCICTKSHFFNNLHHQSVNATFPPNKSLYIILPLSQNHHLPMNWTAEFIIYLFLGYFLVLVKWNKQFFNSLFSVQSGFNDLNFFPLPPFLDHLRVEVKRRIMHRFSSVQ